MQILEGESLDDEYFDEVNEKKSDEDSKAKTVASEKFYYMSQGYD